MSLKHTIHVKAEEFFVDLEHDDTIYSIKVVTDIGDVIILDLDHKRNCIYKFHIDTSLNAYNCTFFAEGFSVITDRVNLYKISIPNPKNYIRCAEQYNKIIFSQN